MDSALRYIKTRVVNQGYTLLIGQLALVCAALFAGSTIYSEFPDYREQIDAVLILLGAALALLNYSRTGDTKLLLGALALISIWFFRTSTFVAIMVIAATLLFLWSTLIH